jgi:hypothetical protein
MPATLTELKVADEVWIATALLHRERPSQPDFSIEEIKWRAAQEAGPRGLRPSVYQHIVQHCVANRAPSPGRYRMLFETAPGRRRLYREGDPCHSERQGSKTTPQAESLSSEHVGLLDWYHDWCATSARQFAVEDPLLKLRELSKGLWTGVDPDEYVRSLRQGWE